MCRPELWECANRSRLPRAEGDRLLTRGGREEEKEREKERKEERESENDNRLATDDPQLSSNKTINFRVVGYIKL